MWETGPLSAKEVEGETASRAPFCHHTCNWYEVRDGPGEDGSPGENKRLVNIEKDTILCEIWKVERNVHRIVLEVSPFKYITNNSVKHDDNTTIKKV